MSIKLIKKTNITEEAFKFKLKEINDLLRKKYLYEKNIGVLEGLSGIVLFQFYYAKYTNNDRYADWGQESLIKIMEIINQGYNVPTFSSGLAGAGWVLSHLSNQGFIEIDNDELLCPLDDYLFSVIKKDINKEYYDFLHGATGYCFYFLERYKSTKNKKIKKSYSAKIKLFIDSITKSAIEDENGIKWISNLHIKSTNHQIKVYNLSLSHGMSSTISFLSELANIKSFRKDCIRLLNKSTNYILSHKLSKNSTSLFPNRILEDGSTDQHSRLAWCYGDFGIGLACLKASKVLKDEELRKKSLFILEHTTNRKTNKDTLVRDAAICHGAFGNAQIYNFLYSETKNELYKDSATYWIQYGMNMSTYKDGYAGFKQWFGDDRNWQPTTSLLEGIAGIGLTIIDYLSKERNTWDECLLIG